MTQFVIHYKSRCPHNAVWNTMYYKLRCNLTQFVIYYKLRNYYKLQRNNALLVETMLSRATLPVSLTKDYGHILIKGPNTEFYPGLILLNTGVLSRMHFRLTENDGVRRNVSECMPLTTGKIDFYALLTLG